MLIYHFKPYFVGGKTAPDDLCPPGHYCPAGTRNEYQYPCANGTWNPHYGKDEQADCYDCILGM